MKKYNVEYKFVLFIVSIVLLIISIVGGSLFSVFMAVGLIQSSSRFFADSYEERKNNTSLSQ